MLLFMDNFAGASLVAALVIGRRDLLDWSKASVFLVGMFAPRGSQEMALSSAMVHALAGIRPAACKAWTRP